MIELPIPHVALDENAREFLRCFKNGDGKIVVSFDMDTLTHQPDDLDPALWGIVLVDIARNVANAYLPEVREAVLERILELFNKEWNRPTDWPKEVRMRTQ